VDQSSKAHPRQLQIRCLRETDLVFADEVRTLAGWNQTLSDWKRFIEHEPEGCFFAEWDGQSAGTVTTTSYGTDLAWIGMMLVHPDFRGRGISTALMNACLDYLQGKGMRCIKLDATPDGEPVYTKLGFKPEWELHRWDAELNASKDSQPGELRAEGTVDWDLDVPIFGANRSAWLDKLKRDSRIVCSNENAFGMLRDGMRANYFGPVVATDENAGCELLQRLLPNISGRTFWDIPDANTAAVAVAEEHGFKPVRSLLRMWLGKENVAGNPKLQFAIGEPATG